MRGTSRVGCRDGVHIAVHHLGGTGGPPLLILAATGFMPKAYLPLVQPDFLQLEWSGNAKLLDDSSVVRWPDCEIGSPVMA